MTDIQILLDNIPAEIQKRIQQKEILKKEFEDHIGKIVIYGHGNLGVELAKGLENANWPVQYFIDANQPTDMNKRVLNLNDANRTLSADTLIIVATYEYDTLSTYPVILNDLRNRGFHNVISVRDLRVWPELFQAGHIHSLFSWDIEHIPAAKVLESFSLLDDITSKDVFKQLLRFFINSPREKMTLCPVSEQYMPTDLYSQIENEHIIDCGAYDGDTMRSFFSALGTWSSYTAIEADPHNVEKIKASICSDLPAHLQGKTRAVHAAVSNETGEVSFCAGKDSAGHIGQSALSKDYTISVPVIKLDDIIDKPATLIKMAVEGFELRALQGAERLVRENQPLLAICGYNYQSDLWEIPLYLKKICPNHHIFLRNYVGIIEYVFYAVPEGRLLSK